MSPLPLNEKNERTGVREGGKGGREGQGGREGRREGGGREGQREGGKEAGKEGDHPLLK